MHAEMHSFWFTASAGQHTVAYRAGPEQHLLDEENVVWDSGEVTGPGAAWPPNELPLQQGQEQQQQPG